MRALQRNSSNQMKIEHLSNELFRWLQTGLCRNFCLLRAKKVKQLRLNAPLVIKLNLSMPAPATKQAPSWKRRLKAAEWKERLQTILWNFGICGKDHVSKISVYNTITNLTAEPVRLHYSHHNLNVSIHDGFVYVCPSQYQQYCAVINTFSINNIDCCVQMQL